MTRPDLLGGVRATCDAIAARHGLEIVDVKLSSQRRSRVLGVIVERVDGLVSLDEISEVSEEISRALDLEDPIPGRYTLEVSSAGIERPLVRPSHYKRFIGSTVSVKCLEPQEGRRNFQGELTEAGEASFLLKLDDGTSVEIPYTNAGRTNLVADWEAELRGLAGERNVMGEGQ